MRVLRDSKTGVAIRTSEDMIFEGAESGPCIGHFTNCPHPFQRMVIFEPTDHGVELGFEEETYMNMTHLRGSVLAGLARRLLHFNGDATSK